MSQLIPVFDSGALRVLDSRCRHPRSGPGPERGDEPTHLALLKRGAFRYHLGRRSFLGDACTALLHQHGTEYRVGHPGEDGDDATVIVLAHEAVDELFDARGARPTEIPLAPRAQLLHARLCVALAERRGDALEREERTMEVLQAIAGPRAGSCGRAVSSAQRRPVSRAREVLAANLSTNIGLAELAIEAGCSPFHLMRLFRAQTGRSLREYRRELRVLAALARLADAEPDLARLAVELGFSHHSHLTQSFRQVLGTTPRRVRAELLGEGKARS